MDRSSPGAVPGRSAALRGRNDVDLYRLLVESVEDYAIFALDATGHVLNWNAGAQRIKGYSAQEIVGQHFSRFYPAEDIAAGKPEAELVIARRDGRVEDEAWRLRKDGTLFWANVVITALRAPDGTITGFAKVTRDLTERRAAQLQAIADARRVTQSDEANRTKGRFLAAMSHELRTPLNAIGGYSDLMLTGIGGPLSTEHELYVRRIRDSQRHLLAVINDILDFSRIEAGHLSFSFETVPLQRTVNAVLPMVATQAASKGLQLRHTVRDQRAARADAAKVEQILLNLLSNAVKFTDAGGEVEIISGRDGEFVTLAVRDSGCGIPSDDLDAIFQPFVQVDRSLTSRQEGTGLGLAISRELATGMGGDLRVESSVGKGSTFTLLLPDAG